MMQYRPNNNNYAVSESEVSVTDYMGLMLRYKWRRPIPPIMFNNTLYIENFCKYICKYF